MWIRFQGLGFRVWGLGFGGSGKRKQNGKCNGNLDNMSFGRLNDSQYHLGSV